MKPLKWDKDHDEFFAVHGRKQRVFCSSLSDVFDNAVDPQWRADLFALIAATPNLDWLLLTKRIGNAQDMIAEAIRATGKDWPWSNVWLGVTVVNQEEADRDIPKLIATPAAKRFLSIEPMLSAINLRHLNKDQETNELDCLEPYLWEREVEQWRGTSDDWEAEFKDWHDRPVAEATGPMHAKVDWVIAGGESGPRARPSHPDWYVSLRDQCRQAGTPFLFKQWGEWLPNGQQPVDHSYSADEMSGRKRNEKHDKDPSVKCLIMYTDGSSHELDEAGPFTQSLTIVSNVGKKCAGRYLDGFEHNGTPS